MNPYFLTISFLILITILTSSEVSRFSSHASEDRLCKSYLDTKAEMQKMAVKSRSDDYTVHEPPLKEPAKDASNAEDDDDFLDPEADGEKQEKAPTTRKSRSLGFNLDRPPNNSRINIYFLMHDKLLIQGYPKDFSLYETLAELMRRLYSEADFYKAGCEYRISDALLEKKEEASTFTTPDELSHLKFEDEEAQEIFYLMLNGSCRTQPLIHFLTFDRDIPEKSQAKKINFLFADKEILFAVFHKNPTLVHKLIHLQESAWEKIIDHEEHRLEKNRPPKNRKNFKDELEAVFDALLTSERLNSDAYKKVFDLTLGKYGKILFVKDTLTGIVKRETVYKRTSKKS